MRNLIGKQVKIRIDGETVSGILLRDMKDRVIVRGVDGTVTAVIKSKISMFTSDSMQDEYLPIYVLACQNTERECFGVRYMKSGKVVASDFDTFMRDCPCKDGSCKSGCIGEFQTLPSKMLSKMVENMVFGDYPEEMK